ncbi:TetR/AcrR family transcriptional regulator [Pseudonocardia spinosispora]|uniref:TetR/AcrR family transcriptional regulator n=1 Tax=Pseudonocardia spinosispora TaxID=103441 RepID=UPI0005627D8A|nr:TetR/AcrR family transcriptional regulator [Pseudonocardia spinosispora]
MARSKPESRTGVVQRRGVERARTLLDAAEALLEEQGYEAATLKAIGERAGVPIASIYHYFADRHQVDAEIMQRHVSAADERIAGALSDRNPHTLPEVVDTFLDTLITYFREHRSLVELWFAGRSPALTELSRQFDRTQADQVHRFLVDRDLVAADTPVFVVQLAFEAGDRLVDVAFRRSPTADDATIVEAGRLITAYLQTYAARR